MRHLDSFDRYYVFTTLLYSDVIYFLLRRYHRGVIEFDTSFIKFTVEILFLSFPSALRQQFLNDGCSIKSVGVCFFFFSFAKSAP